MPIVARVYYAFILLTHKYIQIRSDMCYYTNFQGPVTSIFIWTMSQFIHTYICTYVLCKKVFHLFT